jgi:hypothetical protein
LERLDDPGVWETGDKETRRSGDHKTDQKTKIVALKTQKYSS